METARAGKVKVIVDVSVLRGDYHVQFTVVIAAAAAA